jgi:hypothetical protein
MLLEAKPALVDLVDHSERALGHILHRQKEHDSRHGLFATRLAHGGEAVQLLSVAEADLDVQTPLLIVLVGVVQLDVAVVLEGFWRWFTKEG